MFVVLSLTRPPDHLRGYISRFLNEATIGTYVGKLSTRAADDLWDRIIAVVGDGTAVLIASANNELGYTARTIGDRERASLNADGATLFTRRHEPVDRR